MIQKPLFTTINTIVFPNHSSMFVIGREFSINSVKEALLNFNGELIIGSQKRIGIEKPNLNDIHPFGCVCQVMNHIELPNRTIKFVALAKHRFEIQELADVNNVRMAEGNLCTPAQETNMISIEKKKDLITQLKKRDQDFEDESLSEIDSLKSTKTDFDFIMGFSNFLKNSMLKMRDLTIDEMNQGIFIVDVLTDLEKNKINQGMFELQQILKYENATEALTKIESLLGK